MLLTLRSSRAVVSALALVLLGACTIGGRAYLAGEAATLKRTEVGRVPPRVAAARAATPVAPAPAEADRTAEALNAQLPFAEARIEPMRPFVLKTDAADRARAIHCLAQAVYFEAGREPLAGQQAVAQVVLNRVRHPAFPKSVCGVVYQGADRGAGCQFTFTCDGSLRLAPETALWSRAMSVARRALAGYVDREVGSATHYHADYVSPYWAPTLVKMTRVGAHIFYRRAGDGGQPEAFVGRYDGHEAVVTRAVLDSGDPREAPAELRKVSLGSGAQARTYTVADASAPGGRRTQIAGVLRPVTRAPTLEEVRQINQHLEAMEKQLAAAPAVAAAPSAADAARPANTIAPIAAAP